jgi:hypothetical protein
LLANHRRRFPIPLPSASPYQNPRLLPRLPSRRTEYLLLCVGPITHYLFHFHLHLHFKRANVNNNKRAAAKQRVTRKASASALFTTALRCKVFLSFAPSLCRTPATATTTAAMDLFTFYPPSSVLICKPCGYAVPPTTLSTHIKVHHLHDARHAATNYFDTPQSQNPATLLANYLCERTP